MFLERYREETAADLRAPPLCLVILIRRATAEERLETLAGKRVVCPRLVDEG